MSLSETSSPEFPGKPSPFRSLRNRQFRWLYISNAAFFFAMMGQMVVRSYLAYDITGNSPLALGIVNLAVAVPMLLISPFGGVLADRVERRKLIMGGQAALIVSEVVILVLLFTDSLAFWHLLAMTVVMGSVFPFIMPARQAIVADIVGRRGIQNAMALQMGAMNAGRVVAPALSGFIIYLAGTEAAYTFAVGLYGCALLSMTQVTPSSPPKRLTATTVLGDIAYGMKYVARDAPVRVLMLLSVVTMLLAMPFQSLLPVFSEDVWDVGPRGLGILHAAAGAGGLIGSVIVTIWGETPNKLRLMMTSLMAFGGTLLLFAISPWFVLGVAFVLIADIFASMFQTMNGSTIQVLIPNEVRGRVMSLMMMSFGLTPLGTLPIAAVAEGYGAPVAVGGACVVMMVIGLLFFAFSKSFRNLDAIAAEALERDDGPTMPPTVAAPSPPPVSGVA
jgi:MFS transporter, DHA1 family, staphyloferrin A biosynthesis exporter